MGDCFQAALELVLEEDYYLLVHGVAIGQGPIKGLRHAHAWVEEITPEGVMVYDHSNGREVEMTVEAYYIIGKISPEDVVIYTQEQAREMVLEHETYGPWHELPEGVM